MAELGDDLKHENKIAAWWLLHYAERRKIYMEARKSFTVLKATAIGMPRGSDIGFPTERKSEQLMNLEMDRLWLMTVEDAERCLSEKKRAFLEFRRRAEGMEFQRQDVGRPGWVDYVQARYADWHHRRYGGDYVPTDRTLRNWWHSIVDLTVRIAIRRGCL